MTTKIIYRDRRLMYNFAYNGEYASILYNTLLDIIEDYVKNKYNSDPNSLYSIFYFRTKNNFPFQRSNDTIILKNIFPYLRELSNSNNQHGFMTLRYKLAILYNTYARHNSVFYFRNRENIKKILSKLQTKDELNKLISSKDEYLNEYGLECTLKEKYVLDLKFANTRKYRVRKRMINLIAQLYMNYGSSHTQYLLESIPSAKRFIDRLFTIFPRR